MMDTTFIFERRRRSLAVVALVKCELDLEDPSTVNSNYLICTVLAALWVYKFLVVSQLCLCVSMHTKMPLFIPLFFH